MIAALPLIDVAPYKPYTSIVLIMLVPFAVRLLDMIREAEKVSMRRNMQLGAMMGIAFGLLCLLYSGWFKWSAPGFLFAVLVVFPWRSPAGRSKALLFGAVAFATFGLLAGGHVRDALAENFADNYKYFDVGVEPAYIAMYRNDLPGTLFSWPPLGELGGVGVFSLILYAGLAAAVMLGRSRSLVIGVGSLMAGCWLLRFYYARDLYATGQVQLYPRTTAEILYCLLIFCGYAVFLAVERTTRRGSENTLRSPSGLIGAVCGVLLLMGSAASSICDHYMPSGTKPPGPGWLSWTAHQMKH
jgi:galactan 5-O-arabinofuranosyltransferase